MTCSLSPQTCARCQTAAAILGFSGVLAGTFGAHGLPESMAPSLQESFEVGVRYHLLHAVVTLAVAATLQGRDDAWLVRAATLFTAGVVFFSGSLYAMVYTAEARFGWVTPFGGLLFLAGWFCVFLSAMTRFPMYKSSTS